MQTVVIRRMLRCGSRYHVTNSCGHQYTVTMAEIVRRQLYIGKRVTCDACAETGVKPGRQ